MVETWCDFSSFFVNGNIFFLSKLVKSTVRSLREIQNIFMQSSPRYKLYVFFILSNAHIVDIEYPQGICSPIYVAEDFSGLDLQLSIFYQTFIHGVLSEFIYCLIIIYLSWQSNSTKIFIFTYFFMTFKLIFSS